MKKKLITASLIVFVLAIAVALVWRGGEPSVEFVGYRWNSTNRQWYAELCLFNKMNKTIWYDAFKDGSATFLYQFKQTNGWKTGYIGVWHEGQILQGALPPKQKIHLLAPLRFEKNSRRLMDIDEPNFSLNSLNYVLTPAPNTPLRVGVGYYPWTNTSPVPLLLKAKMAMKMELGIKDMLSISWCPELLIAPTNPPPEAKR